MPLDLAPYCVTCTRVGWLLVIYSLVVSSLPLNVYLARTCVEAFGATVSTANPVNPIGTTCTHSKGFTYTGLVAKLSLMPGSLTVSPKPNLYAFQPLPLTLPTPATSSGYVSTWVYVLTG